MSAFCVWNDRTSNDTDNVRQLAKTYTLDSELCAVQYELLGNDPSVKDVTSLTSLVSHMYNHGVHATYHEIYKMVCILLTVLTAEPYQLPT